jgi:FlaA1/EpsC-like NDP-sugar epimerase
MFQRYSTKYMTLLFLLDLVLVHSALQAAVKLRFVLPFGLTLDPAWPEGWLYFPTPGLRVVIALLWIFSFLLVSVYSPRKIFYWINEVQRLVLAHSIAASGLAAILFLADRQLPRLAFLYFYILVLVLLLGYRATLRAWYRLKPGGPLILSRVLIVGAGPVGQRVVDRLRLRGWKGIRLVGFVDDDPGKRGTFIADLPVLGHCDDIASVVSDYAVDEVFIALPRHATPA